MKAIILAGGTGTRLWPLSRRYFPKQFIGFRTHSLLQEALQRSLALSGPNGIYIATSEDHQYLIRNQAEETGATIPEDHLLLEPAGRNTLPAITWAMKVIAQEREDEAIVVFPSDHLLDEEALDVIRSAVPLASEYIVTFGVKLTNPHTGFGYILPGEAVGSGYKVREFKEKPDATTAQSYVDAGGLWNSGIFLTTPRLFFQELARWNPAISEAFSLPDPDYANLPSLSIDHGLLERSARVVVVLLDVPWSDLGTFGALYETKEYDEHGNAGEAVCIETAGCFFIHAKEKRVGAIGIRDLLVIDTPDALLLYNRSQAEQVKELVALLESQKDPVVDLHTLVHRPWGTYLILEGRHFYKIKRITVKPGKQLSLQLHHHRSEHWIVVSGTAEVVLDGETRLVHQGESTFVKAGVKHRVRNPGKISLEIIEAAVGEYISEDDIVRFEDEYGRETGE